jgi:hypothetical protein
MAKWQCVFYLVEKKSFEDLSAGKQFIEGEYFNEEPYWIYSHKSKNLFLKIDRILQQNRSWCNEINLYGIEDSNCLEVVFDNTDYITSVSFRIDFRNSYEIILKKLIAFCILKELVIIDGETITDLGFNYELIDIYIRSSKQWNTYYNHMKDNISR